MLRTPSVLVSNNALGLSLHASQGLYLINFQGISSEKISDIILCPHSTHKARPRQGHCALNIFSSWLSVLTVVTVLTVLTVLPFNIFIIIALVWPGRH